MTSLKGRLLAWLLPPLLVVGIVAAGGAYVFMEGRLTDAYDLDLGDIARALVPYIRARDDSVSLELTELADAILKADSTDQIYYSIRDAQGRVVVGDRVLKAPPRPIGPAPYFWNDTRNDRPIRAVALQALIAGRPVLVMAAETTRKRERAARDAMLSAIVPVVLLLGAVVLAIVFGVRRGLRPVDRLREEVQARSPLDLRPIDEPHVAGELRPLIHELNGMLARLDEAQHTQARFIANAAHQLRTPIAGLVTQLDLARSDTLGREAHLAHAREGAARLARLAQQILSLAAADPTSNPGAREERCDLAEIVTNQASSWLRAATALGVDIEFDLGGAPLRGNALLVGELASNLVDNAARYGARNVRIATRGEANCSLLEVTDDGPGIPPTKRTRIFERFHRFDNQSSVGSGLGLAIVSEIAQRHRAQVEVSDAPEGRGTRVRVSFPSA